MARDDEPFTSRRAEDERREVSLELPEGDLFHDLDPTHDGTDEAQSGVFQGCVAATVAAGMVEYLQGKLATPGGIAILAGILLAVLMTNACHEGGHALAAWWAGDRRPSIRRRATLNPIKHFHWFLTLVMPVLSVIFFGWVLGGARPVLIQHVKIGPRRMALAALAGPAGNFLFCGFAISVMGFALARGWVDRVNPIDTMAWRIVKPAVWYSALLGVVNLVPIPPLDASHVVAMFLPEKLRVVWRLLAPLGILAILGYMLWIGGQLEGLGLGRGSSRWMVDIETKMEDWLHTMGDFWEGRT